MNSISSLLEPVKAFFKEDFARILLLLVIFAGLYSFVALDVSAPVRPADAKSMAEVDFFYLSTCPHCRQQIPTNEQLAAEFTQVKWNYHDMSSAEVQDLSAQMMQARNYTPIKATPITVIGQKVFVGFYPDSQPAQMRNAIKVLINQSAVVEKPAETNTTPFSLRALNLPIVGQLQPEKMDPLSRSLVLGAIDGFNPCAVWGVIALICMTMLTRNWKLIGLLVGAFILFSAIMHFMFVGGFASPYFVLGIMRYVMTMMGVCALFIGIYQIRAVWKMRKEGKETVTTTFSALLNNNVIRALLVGLLLMAVLFNSLGSICAAAVPTVYNQAMAKDGISGGAQLGFLAIYNVAYMLLDVVMLGAALLLMSGKLGKTVAMATQGFCALLLTAFGSMLLFAPALLVA